MTEAYAKEKLYRSLAEAYGWTFNEIADMTPAQQAIACGESFAPTMYFETEEDYVKWLKHRQPS